MAQTFFRGQYRTLSVKVVGQLGFLALLTIIGPRAFQALHKLLIKLHKHHTYA